MSHVTANLAFQFQGLLLGRFRELSLKRIFLPAISSLLTLMVSLAFGQSSPLSSLVKRDRMCLMLFAFRAVCFDFFGNIHVSHDQLCIKKTTRTLILFRRSPKVRDRRDFEGCLIHPFK
jgi:hypothetical protein